MQHVPWQSHVHHVIGLIKSRQSAKATAMIDVCGQMVWAIGRAGHVDTCSASM